MSFDMLYRLQSTLTKLSTPRKGAPLFTSTLVCQQELQETSGNQVTHGELDSPTTSKGCFSSHEKSQ